MRAAAISLLAVAACQAPRPRPEPVRGDAGPAAAIFTYARPYIAREEPPARFSAPLPFTVEALAEPNRHPPEGAIAAALARGDADMQARVGAALRKIAARGEMPASLAAYFDRLFGARPTAATCDFLNGQVSDASRRSGRAALWLALARCRGAEYAPTFARADAPDRAVVRWYALAETEGLPFTARFAQAAQKIARRGLSEAREVGEALGHIEGRRAIRAVRELQQRLRDPERRALVAVGLSDRPEKAARALVQHACSHPRVRFDDACARLDRRPFHLDGDVRAADLDVEWLVAAHGAGEVVAALDRCVVDGEWDDERLLCLHRLARLDWEQAAGVAASIEESLAASSPLVDPVRTLVRFPEPGAVALALTAAGLSAVDEQSEVDAVTPAEILVARGRALRFDASALEEEHAQLLLDLAALVGTDLDGFLFEALVSSASPRLRAWGDGKLFEVPVRRMDDWLDLPAVVGFLNSLLRARASERRFLPLAGGGPSVTVVGAPALAIEAAVADQVIVPRWRSARE